MRVFFVLAGAAALLGCGAGTANLRAPRPEPRVEAHWRLDSDVGLEVTGVDDERECSVQPELDTICVEGLATGLTEGLTGVLTPFMRIADGGTGTYLARLRIVDFVHGRAADPAVDPTRQTSRLAERPDLEVRLVYRFELFDRAGRAVVSLERTTTGPRPIRDVEHDGDAAILALENEVLEEIASAVDVARLGTTAASGGDAEASTGTQTTSATPPQAEPPPSPGTGDAPGAEPPPSPVMPAAE